jgi:hypothetical protein
VNLESISSRGITKPNLSRTSKIAGKSDLWILLTGSTFADLFFTGCFLLESGIVLSRFLTVEGEGAPGDQVQATRTADPPIDTEIDLSENYMPIEIPGLGLELPRLSPEEEIEISWEAAAEFESQYAINRSFSLIDRVSRIGNSFVPYQSRQGIP